MDFIANCPQLVYGLFCFVALFSLGVEGANLPFSHVHTGSCGSRDSVFRSFWRLSPIDCLAECGLRSKCVALNHRRLYDNYCELLENTNVVTNTNGCMYVRRENIDFTDQNLMDCGCAVGEVCDRNTGACTGKECSPVRSINNGILFGNKYAQGDSYSIHCNDIYEPYNNVSMATCMSNGQWDGVPNCVLKECQTFTIDYGSLLGTDFRVGSTLTYSCDAGYVELNGVYTTTCLTTVQWDYQPTCIENVCTHLTFDNGQIVGTDYSVGMTLSVTCDTNYVEETGVSTVTCLTSRQWDYVPTCIFMPCPSGWDRLDDSCYFISPSSYSEKSQGGAETQCENQGGYLAELDTSQKNEFIRTKLYEMGYPGDYGYWIGLKKLSGSWKWMHSNTYLSYEDWDSGQPQSKGEDLVIVNKAGRHWHDVDDDRTEQYICEKPIA